MLSKYDEIRAKRARGDKGFTLIELLVVVVIMGILIAIAVPVYLNYQNNAKKKSLESDVRGAIATVEMCLSEHNGTWDGSCATATTGGLDVKKSTGNTVTVTGGTTGYTITGSRTDPAWNVRYVSSTSTTTSQAGAFT